MKTTCCLLVLLWSSWAGAAPVQDCQNCPPLETIPRGKFDMGDENMAETAPVHSVVLKTFAMGTHEVTQAEWYAIMETRPSKATDCGDTCPVENVSWHETQEFLRRLSAITGRHYRLPSEAEWEYACRAGARDLFCGGDQREKLGWFGKAGSSPHPVGQKLPNAWGLYDMNGNVWEWVQDCSSENFAKAPSDGSAWVTPDCRSRVVRGGSWWGKASSRLGLRPDYKAADIGFRVLREEIDR